MSAEGGRGKWPGRGTKALEGTGHPQVARPSRAFEASGWAQEWKEVGGLQLRGMGKPVCKLEVEFGGGRTGPQGSQDVRLCQCVYGTCVRAGLCCVKWSNPSYRP